MFEGFACPDCFLNSGDDHKLFVDLLKARLSYHGIELPTSLETINLYMSRDSAIFGERTVGNDEILDVDTETDR